jgi:ABC-type sugar transport system ATPase subunit
VNVNASALVLSGVKKSFGGVEALRGASMACEQGEIHALIGENGAGKSTLIKVLAGAVRADEGDVFLKGDALALRSPLGVLGSPPSSRSSRSSRT